jgi:hypothetical protein
MPLKLNYKVDRWALPVPEREGVEGEHEALRASPHESRKGGESYETLANSLSFGIEIK